MQDVLVLGLTDVHWPLLALAAVAGAVGGWLAILMLLYPVRPTGVPGLVPVQGRVAAAADAFAAFAVEHLLRDLPPPRRFFEQLGPDRFRREFERALRENIDGHVDDVMMRRNGMAWDALSSYARARIYNHVHRRLPYVVDDFVDHVQRELDDIVHPASLLRRWFAANPERLTAIFLRVYGADLRATLLPATLAAILLAAPLTWLLQGPWAWTLVGGLAAGTGALVVLLLFARPEARIGFWPFGWQGSVHRRRRRFLDALSAMVVHDALGWQSITGEFLRGTHAGRVRHMMRREVAGILDVPMFRGSMQLLLGPEGFAELKSAAVDKAVEMLGTAPLSGALREHFRREMDRTLAGAAGDVPATAWAALWRTALAPAWKPVPLLAMLAGLALGWACGALLAA